VGSIDTVTQRRRGSAINLFCGTLDDPSSAREFLANEAAYCLRFGLDRAAQQAVRDRDFLALIHYGGHVGQLDKLAALSGLSTLTAIRKRRGLVLDVLLGGSALTH
jgi:protocatechuate 4,5-dioxygenase, alpha chain